MDGGKESIIMSPRNIRIIGAAEMFDTVSRDITKVEDVNPRIISLYEKQFVSGQFIGAIGPLKGKHLLDVGIGWGTTSRAFLESGAIVTGLDVSSESLNLARRYLSCYSDRLTIVHGDITEYPYPSHVYDIACSIRTMCYIKNKQLAIGAMVSMLCSGGVIALCLKPKASVPDVYETDSRAFQIEGWPCRIEELVSILRTLNCKILMKKRIINKVPVIKPMGACIGFWLIAKKRT